MSTFQLAAQPQKKFEQIQSWALLSEMDEDLAVSEVENLPTKSSPPPKVWKDVNVTDSSTDSIQFPLVGEDPEVIAQRKLDQELATKRQNRENERKRNFELNKLQEISILYGPNKCKKRSLQVTSMKNFNYHLKLSDKMKTHTKDGRLNNYGEDMKTKIKMANYLLNWCYKHPTKPSCFVYAIAEIELKEKVIKVNAIKNTNKNPFNIVELEYYMN